MVIQNDYKRLNLNQKDFSNLQVRELLTELSQFTELREQKNRKKIIREIKKLNGLEGVRKFIQGKKY